MSHATVSLPRITVGLDLGDRYSRFCLLDESSGVIEAVSPEGARGRRMRLEERTAPEPRSGLLVLARFSSYTR